MAEADRGAGQEAGRGWQETGERRPQGLDTRSSRAGKWARVRAWGAGRRRTGGPPGLLGLAEVGLRRCAVEDIAVVYAQANLAERFCPRSAASGLFKL